MCEWGRGDGEGWEGGTSLESQEAVKLAPLCVCVCVCVCGVCVCVYMCTDTHNYMYMYITTFLGVEV